MSYTNPVIPGFYPDPSVCRVAEDYYLVTSTFDFFPGIPVFHSKDLVHWRQIGHCCTRGSQLPLAHANTGNGIYAPTIRYINGRFYMITSNVTDGGHFFVYTDNPAGEWSEPVWVDTPGFDPDLFVDDDGKAYLSQHNLHGPYISQWEIDLETGKVLSDERVIWKGFEDIYCEAPHIYKINGTYYLLAAEGGTHRGHMIIAARGSSPSGPFEGCPHNPILSHRAIVFAKIQAAGHGDLIQAHDGSWWILFLGIRQVDGRFHHLGRETFLAPVTWEDGWPVINGGEEVKLQMECNSLPPHPWPPVNTRDDFDAPNLSLYWNFRRNPKDTDWSLTGRPGWLKLRCSEVSLNDQASHSFLGRRQCHFDCIVSTLVDFQPHSEAEEAGLTIINSESYYYDIAVTLAEGKRSIVVHRRVADMDLTAACEPIDDGPVVLEVHAERKLYTMGYRKENGEFKPLASGIPQLLSSEVAGGFTGVYFGMYATANGKESDANAYFDWFDYVPVS